MNNPKKRESGEPFGEIMKTMNQFFHEKPVKGFLQTMDEFFKNPFPFAASFQVDVSETDDDYVITAQLPGIKKEQIQLDVYNQYLTISVQAIEIVTEENDKQSIVKSQQSVQRSSRTIPLPQHINEKRVKASYENGLLQIKVPKQKGKRILIKE